MELVSDFKTRLKEALEEKGKNYTDFAKELGVSKQTISAWLKGERSPKSPTATQVALKLNVSPAWLSGFDVPRNDISDIFSYDSIHPIKLKKFPLLGEIACGKPIWADEDKESYIMADMDIDADFCLTAKGNSMINARIQNGDIVFIKQMDMVRNGDIAAVVIDDEATLKRVYYYPDKNKLVLNPENPDFEPLVYINEELNDIRILGKAVYFMSVVK